MPLVKKTLYRENPRIWYWALMDLGTELKKTVPNPNRRSVHYTKQTRFEGSDRQIRGSLLQLFLKQKLTGEDEILGCVAEEPCRVRKILGDLENEGFIERRNNCYLLSD
jgi:A/G-specific adenine glycosylase